jgi:hypothetical protein
MVVFVSNFNVDISELDETNNQECDGHSGHAQKVGPIHAEENGVTIHVEDGE